MIIRYNEHACCSTLANHDSLVGSFYQEKTLGTLDTITYILWFPWPAFRLQRACLHVTLRPVKLDQFYPPSSPTWQHWKGVGNYNSYHAWRGRPPNSGHETRRYCRVWPAPLPSLPPYLPPFSVWFDKENPSFTRLLRHFKVLLILCHWESVTGNGGFALRFKASVRGGFLAMSGQNLRVSKSNRLPVMIFFIIKNISSRFFFIKSRHVFHTFLLNHQ